MAMHLIYAFNKDKSTGRDSRGPCNLLDDRILSHLAVVTLTGLGLMIPSSKF